MKLSLVITDGLRQIAMTPQTEDEKNILQTLTSEQWDMEIKRGQFFICAGGYARFANQSREPDSVMFVLEPKQATQ